MKSAFAVADKPEGDRGEVDLEKIREHASGDAASYDEALRRVIKQGQEATAKDYYWDAADAVIAAANGEGVELKHNPFRGLGMRERKDD
jgi:hypothetical protein